MKTTKLRLIVVVALAFIVMAGCGAPSKRLDRNTANISIIDNKSNNLRAEIHDLRAQVSKLASHIAQLEEQLASVPAAPPEPVVVVVPEPMPVAPAPEPVVEMEPVMEIEPEPEPVVEQKPGLLKVKVLASTTDIKPAKDLAALLTEKGFSIESVDFASSSNYIYDTFYYAEGYEVEAEGMAAALGGRTVLKPITWESAFDVIVVKGEGGDGSDDPIPSMDEQAGDESGEIPEKGAWKKE